MRTHIRRSVLLLLTSVLGATLMAAAWTVGNWRYHARSWLLLSAGFALTLIAGRHALLTAVPPVRTAILTIAILALAFMCSPVFIHGHHLHRHFLWDVVSHYH